MTNNKFKHASYNMQVEEVLRINANNLCTLFLCLYEAGESKKKIIEADEYLRSDYAVKHRKQAQDEVLDVVIDRFLNSVYLNFDGLRKIIRTKCEQQLKKLRMPIVFYEGTIVSLTEEFALYLMLINERFNYGYKRLSKLIDSFATYNKDPFEEVKNVFGFVYKDKGELTDFANAQKKEKVKYDYDMVKSAQADLDGLRAYQSAVMRKAVSCEVDKI